MCTKCGEKSSMLTSKQISGRTFNVNQRAVYAMFEQGKGREALASFSSIMEMPSLPASIVWSMHKDVIYNTSLKLKEECIEDGK